MVRSNKHIFSTNTILVKIMKVIFLDIDGVLATTKQYFTNRTKFREKNIDAKELNLPYPWDKECVDVFNEILDATNAVIVLSSDWKHHWSLEEIDKVFKWNGVIKSPIAYTPNDSVSFGNLTMNRAWEIEKYIREVGVDDYVVIDDLWVNKYMKSNGSDHRAFITRESEGLKQTGLKDKIIKKLNNVS